MRRVYVFRGRGGGNGADFLYRFGCLTHVAKSDGHRLASPVGLTTKVG